MTGAANGAAAGEAVYQPKNILVTGGAGFIASWVVIKLLNQHPECKVRGARLKGQAPAGSPPRPAWGGALGTKLPWARGREGGGGAGRAPPLLRARRATRWSLVA